jgi:hypothetical protein
VPGRAAYLDGPRRLGDAAELLGRRRGRHPRGRPPDRQVVREQVADVLTLTGPSRCPARRRGAAPAPRARAGGRRSVPLRRAAR